MRPSLTVIVPAFLLAVALSASAATGKVVKVLPQFLDLKGRHALSPSLYDRDAYQAQLREHPDRRSGMRFDVLWRARGAGDTKLKLRVELRGTAQGNLPSQKTLESEVKAGAASRWTTLTLGGDDYKKIGEVTAWRATLWNGAQADDPQGLRRRRPGGHRTE